MTVAILSEVVGATIFAWVIGNLVNLVLNLDPAERNRKSMMNYLAEYIRQVPLSSKASRPCRRITPSTCRYGCVMYVVRDVSFTRDRERRREGEREREHAFSR